MVVIIDADQISELQVACHASSFARNAFHGTAITKHAVCVIVDQIEARFIENGRRVGLSDGKANSIGEALTQRTGCNFNSRCVMGFGVSRSNTVDFLDNRN
jgi:hypothetical protein